MSGAEQAIGIFTTDTELIVRTWDPWLAEVTGIAANEAQAQQLTTLVPDLAARGLLARFQQVLDDGVVVVLAPALHHYLIPCPPRTPVRHFALMQQRVTIAPLRDHEAIVGTIVTIEDVTARRDRERDLAEDMASPDESTRQRAAQALADEADAPAPMLIEAFADTSWRVRQAAVSGLAQHIGEETIAGLVHALRDDHRNPSVLNSALQALSRAGEDAVAPLIALLGHPDAELRGYVALALGEIDDARAIPALKDALDDPDPNVRYHAIEALGKVGAAEAVDALLAVAESRDFFLAFPAIDALAQLGDPRAAARIVPLLGDELLCPSAANALGRLGDITTVAPLGAALNSPAAAASAIAQALAALYDRYEAGYGEGAALVELARSAIAPSGAQNLLDALAAARGDDQRALARVLSWLDGPAVERTLAGLLAQPALRGELLEALVRRGPAVLDLLIEQLDADDLETRQVAAVALGRIGDPRAVPALTPLLADDPALASVAAAALAKIGDERAFEPLLGLLGHPSAAVRQAAIGALNSLSHPDLVARAGALLHAPDPSLRESAVRIVGYFGYPAYLDPLIERCQDSDERVRRAAIEHLPFVEHPGVLPALADALRGGTTGVRAAAARALAYAADAQAIALLCGALDDEDAWVRYYAARSLGHQHAAEAIDALARAARSDPAQQVRIAAAEALGRIGGERSVAALAPLAELGDDDLARAALDALGQSSHPNAQAPLLAALHAPAPARRLAAVEALGKQRRAELAAPLQRLAQADADPQVAQAAIAALAHLATPEAIAALIELTAEPARRKASIAALAQLGEQQIDLVARGLANSYALVRQAVVAALGHMKHRRASEHIGAALDDPEASVRLAAATALGHLDSEAARGRLAALAQSDPDAAVRRAAHMALQQLQR